MTTSDTTTTTLAVLPIDAITVRDGWNPRSADDDTERDQLTESVRAQGILQPLLVERTDEGPVLIDGHRRLASARAAGLTEVPVIERTSGEGDAPQLAAALAANMRRRGLDPIEEARAYERATRAGWPQRRIAEAVGCSARHVSQRLRLLRLPDVVQEAIGAAALPLSAVPAVETIASVAPAVAEAVAAALATGTFTATEFTAHPERALTELAQSGDDGERPTLVALPGYQDIGSLALPADLATRAEAVGVHGVNLSAEDMDAARAFGCLIEFAGGEDRYWRRGFVADVAWLADRVALHVERAEERARQEAERRAAAGVASGQEGAGDEDRASESDEERRRRERQAATENRSAARLANLDLGRRALLAYDEPTEITMQMARAVVLAALHHHAPEAAQGLRLTHERLQRTETTTTKAGQHGRGSTTPSAARPRRRLLSGSRGRARRPSLSAARCRRSSERSTPIRRPCRSPSDGPPLCPAATAVGSRKGSQRSWTRSRGRCSRSAWWRGYASPPTLRRSPRRTPHRPGRARRGSGLRRSGHPSRSSLRPRWPERPPGSLRPGGLRCPHRFSLTATTKRISRTNQADAPSVLPG